MEQRDFAPLVTLDQPCAGWMPSGLSRPELRPKGDNSSPFENPSTGGKDTARFAETALD